jgi:hypothetical protein
MMVRPNEPKSIKLLIENKCFVMFFYGINNNQLQLIMQPACEWLFFEVNTESTTT